MPGCQKKKDAQDERGTKLADLHDIKHIYRAGYRTDSEGRYEVQDGKDHAGAHDDYEHHNDVERAKCAGVNKIFCVQLFTACTGGLNRSVISHGISFSIARNVLN